MLIIIIIIIIKYIKICIIETDINGAEIVYK